MIFHPIWDDLTKIDRYEQTVVRPKLERKRQQLIARIPSLAGDELVAAERALAEVEAKLKGLA
ncbi:hypothetical protein [Rhizobium etli]|uniref:hypothetical protein n=1 Tax=Rhizobium etli TaxID=29449 RepID=UPI00093DDB60|nr:hypothetical protein [Rhizobium etli]